MRIFNLSTLRSFWLGHPDAEQPLKAWYREAKRAEWRNPQDIRDRYAHASFIGSDRVVFNIKGNHYRLVARLHYQRGDLYIRFLGTHAEYDNIDVSTV